MQIDSIIGELLLRNNCVVVPDFGGFIATQSHAAIDFSTGKMQAPKKSVLFNKQLLNNDGLLITAFAGKYKLSYDQAFAEVKNQVNTWIEVLNTGKRITFDKVGYLYLDNEKNIRFEQDRFFNLLLQSFGMGQVQFVAENAIEIKTLETAIGSNEVKPEVKIAILENVKEAAIIKLFPETKAETVETKENTVALEPQVIPITKGSSKKLIRYIAAACILPIAFYSVWIPAKTDVLESGMFSFHDFNPFHKQAAETYDKLNFKTNFSKVPITQSFEEIAQKLPGDISVFPLEIENEDLGEENDIFYVKLKDLEKTNEIIRPEAQETLPVETLEKTTTVKVKEAVSGNKSGKFKVVAGSFSNDNNALSLMNQLKAKGFSAFTYPDSNGLIRVIAGTTDSNSEASAMVSKLSEIQVSSWILK